MIKKMVEIGILFDFYGYLLTKKQRDAIELYYLKDLSLAEIGERIEVSRQGVYDVLKRGEKNLYSYEDKLGLVKKFKQNEEDIKKIINLSENILLTIEKENTNLDYIEEKVKEIKSLGLDLVER